MVGTRMLKFEPDQAEKLVELGAKLKQIREEKSLSLEQISGKTMIQTRILSAIEAGEFEQLPEPVYTQGFIRRFADALDLNGAEFASALPTRALSYSHKPEHREYRSPQLRPVHLYLIYIVVIVAAGVGLSYLNSASKAPFNASSSDTPGSADLTSSTPEAPTSPTQGAKPSAQTPTTPQKPTPKPPGTQPLKVSVSLQGESWLEVVADGKSVFEGSLPSGTKRTWTAKKNLTIYSGNAGAVLVTANGGQAKPIGASGAVDQVSFKAPNAAPRSPAPE